MKELTMENGDVRDVPPVEERLRPCQYCETPVLEGGLKEAHEEVCDENPDNQ